MHPCTAPLLSWLCRSTPAASAPTSSGSMSGRASHTTKCWCALWGLSVCGRACTGLGRPQQALTCAELPRQSHRCHLWTAFLLCATPRSFGTTCNGTPRWDLHARTRSAATLCSAAAARYAAAAALPGRRLHAPAAPHPHPLRLCLQDVAGLGVCAIYAPQGLTAAAWQKGLQQYAARRTRA